MFQEQLFWLQGQYIWRDITGDFCHFVHAAASFIARFCWCFPPALPGWARLAARPREQTVCPYLRAASWASRCRQLWPTFVALPSLRLYKVTITRISFYPAGQYTALPALSSFMADVDKLRVIIDAFLTDILESEPIPSVC